MTTLVTVVIVQDYLKKKRILQFEYTALILFSILGLTVLTASSNVMLIYLSIELQSLAFYALAAFAWASDYSVESGLKYFVIGSLASCLLLFGFVLLYISTGSLLLESFQKVYTGPGCFCVVFSSICFLIAALLFKVAAAPFHA